MAILLSGEEVLIDEVMTMTLATYTSMSMVVVVDHHHHLTNVNELGKEKTLPRKPLCSSRGARKQQQQQQQPQRLACLSLAFRAKVKAGANRRLLH